MTPASEELMASESETGCQLDGALKTIVSHVMSDGSPALTMQRVQEITSAQGWEPSFLQDNSEATIDSDTSHFVLTEDMEEAAEVMEDKGRVVLCGSPGTGKTTLGHALLRRWRDKGFKPYVLTKMEEWHKHVGEVKRSVVLMDGVLGTSRVNKTQHGYWKSILPNLLRLIAKGCFKLVLTIYPHVLRELQVLDARTESPLMDDVGVVKLMRNPLHRNVKETLLNFHFKEIAVELDAQQDFVDRILRKDVSGSAFLWCCRQMVLTWQSSEDPTSIFTAPAEAYVPLLQLMHHESEHGDTFAAVLALTMLGLNHFLLKPLKVQQNLLRLGFRSICDDQLEKYAHFVKGSVLSENGDGFYSRVLYDAAGLALGRSFRLPILLKVCDLQFFVQYVCTKETATVFSVPVGPDLELIQALMERVYKETVRGRLPEICQHPSLQSLEFLDKLEDFCLSDTNFIQRLMNAENPSLKRLLTARDEMHGLPLLYWSIFSRSHNLTKWCLKIMTEQKLLPSALPHALVAWSILQHWPDEAYRRLGQLVKSTLIKTDSTFPSNTLLLPLLKTDQCITQEAADLCTLFCDRQLEERQLLYLSSPTLPIPTTVINVQVSEAGLSVQVGNRRWWYLAMRLLSDRTSSQMDDDGNTVLQIAENTRNMEIIKLAIKCRILHAVPSAPAGISEDFVEFYQELWCRFPYILNIIRCFFYFAPSQKGYLA